MPNKRKPGQTMFTFWLPDEEAQAAREAVAALDTTITDECRRALRNAAKRAARIVPGPSQQTPDKQTAPGTP